MKAPRDTPRLVQAFDHREKMLEKVKARRFGRRGDPPLNTAQLGLRIDRAQRGVFRAKTAAGL